MKTGHHQAEIIHVALGCKKFLDTRLQLMNEVSVKANSGNMTTEKKRDN